MNIICKKEDCTGCAACYNSCPKQCITMKEDAYGYLYPEIDKEKCIDCGLCRKKCAAVNEIELKTPQETYASWSLEKEDKGTCTSGGMATVFSRKIIKNGGIVYGAVWNKDASVCHQRVETLEDIDKLKGSKYVHSYIGDSYRKIKQDLEEQKQVLFIGTPCQVAGLKTYLGKEYEGLYVVDLICHGVPSQKFLKEYIRGKLKKSIEIDKIMFRTPEGFRLAVVNKGKTENEEPAVECLYFMGFLKGLFYRENCYHCNYAQSKRCSDITIGDFWGLGAMEEFKNERKDSISVTLINTEKGKILFEICKENLFSEKRKLEEAVNGNSQLRHPSQKHKNYRVFREQYIVKGFRGAARKALRKEIIMAPVKRVVKKNQKVYYTIRNLLKKSE